MSDLKRLLELSVAVEGLFRSVWPKWTVYPDGINCRLIAFTLWSLENDAATQDAADDFDFSKIRALQKSVRALQRVATPARSELVRQYELIKVTLEEFPELRGLLHKQRKQISDAIEALDEIESASATIEALPNKRRPHDCPARRIADTAEICCRQCNIALPRSCNPNDPLTQFVSGALQLIGMGRSDSAVSDDLRGRRGGGKAARKSP